tara:strand:- start:325 stop:582 length:258 start_codon:yes stop_codon:yes gene_type:complete
LYLDYYHKVKRKTEYLRLFLTPNLKTKTEREVNKKNKQLGETICAQRQIKIQNDIYGFQDIKKFQGSFIAYLTALAKKKNSSSGN